MTYNSNDSIFNAHYGQTMSPAMQAQGMSSPDFNSLLESFTNSQYAGDDTLNSFNQPHSGNFLPYQQSGPAPLFQQGAYVSPKTEDSPFAPSQAGDVHPFDGGLRLQQNHFDAAVPPPPSSYLTEQPTPNTVSRLEEAAAQHHTSVTAHQSYTGGIGRQSRSSTLSDGVPIAGLSLDSPRHSLSTSSTSSPQNSPTTPVSGFSLDGNVSSFAMQQQRSMGHFPQRHAYGKCQGLDQNVTPIAGNPLSASLPPSYLHESQPMHETYHYQHYPSATGHYLSRSIVSAPLVPSPSRLSSAGLMDQVVNSRRALASPLTGEVVSFPPATAIPSKTSGKMHGRSRSGTSASPPSTPARSALRSSRRPGQVNDAPVMPVSEQTPSQAGPCRTPAKSSALNTPKRPDLRRTASHTPHGSARSSPVAVGSAGHSSAAHLARLSGGGIELDFAGSDSMTRSTSSPGWALTGSVGTRPSSSSSIASSTSGSAPSRRSSQAAGLLMSPIPPNGGPLSAPAALAATAHVPVSHAQALQAVAQLRLYLSQQAAYLQTAPPQSAATVVGTYEQLHSVDDLYRRVHAKISTPS